MEPDHRGCSTGVWRGALRRRQAGVGAPATTPTHATPRISFRTSHLSHPSSPPSPALPLPPKNDSTSCMTKDLDVALVDDRMVLILDDTEQV